MNLTAKLTEQSDGLVEDLIGLLRDKIENEGLQQVRPLLPLLQKSVMDA